MPSSKSPRTSQTPNLSDSTYVGHLQGRRSMPGDQLTNMPSASYLRQVIELLTADVRITPK